MVKKMLTDSHVGREQKIPISWIKKLSAMNSCKITGTKINTGQTTRIELVWIDRMIMNNSQASPDINKLSIWSQTRQIKVWTNTRTRMKFDIVNFHRQEKIMTPEKRRSVRKRFSSADSVLMNGMSTFDRTSLPMMSRKIDIVIKFPSTIDLKSFLSDKLCTSIKFDKSNTIITNLTTNMLQKRSYETDKIRFLRSNGSPVITTGTNCQKLVKLIMKSMNVMRTTPVPNQELT
jgi:hypothetical protein